MSAPMPPVLGAGLDPRNIEKAIGICKALGSDHHVPLLQAVGVGRIAMTMLGDRLARPNLYALNREKRSGLVLIGDDEGNTTGPAGWAAAAQAMQWARGGLIHATGGDRRSYMLAVTMAEQVGRLLLIECSSDAAEAWASALQAASVPAVILLPTGDSVHPVEPERERAA